MKAINQREPGFTYIKSYLIIQIPRFMLITNYHVISPLRFFGKIVHFNIAFYNIN